MRIRIPFFRGIKKKIRASLGIKKKSKFPPLPGVKTVSLREIIPEAIQIRERRGPAKVSVIIPCYGQVHHTLNCLASFADNPPDCEVEILVVEDASRDRRIGELRRVKGITLIENEYNLGFLKSCNAAARLASGKYLYFLNNDTILDKRAIDELVEFAEETPDAGLVGSRLLYPSGRLQEAGGIVWADASAWNYGRNDDPRKPQYQYVREADYISGAAILIPRDIWEKLGGFDEIYAPAYCEDTDFAFRVRQDGFKGLLRSNFDRLPFRRRIARHGHFAGDQGASGSEFEDYRRALGRGPA